MSDGGRPTTITSASLSGRARRRGRAWQSPGSPERVPRPSPTRGTSSLPSTRSVRLLAMDGRPKLSERGSPSPRGKGVRYEVNQAMCIAALELRSPSCPHRLACAGLTPLVFCPNAGEDENECADTAVGSHIDQVGSLLVIVTMPCFGCLPGPIAAPPPCQPCVTASTHHRSFPWLTSASYFLGLYMNAGIK